MNLNIREKSKASNPFVGLRAYKSAESKHFYGREEDVEELLLILQKNKLVNLAGPAGSGKSSLLNAGLIPRLKEGFVGQAGRDWAICSFRPGISPIENFCHALTSGGLLNLDNKPNTSDYNDFKSHLGDFGAMGLAKIYKNSEIFNKKNLLVIIDQLEDLFVFNKFFNDRSSEEDEELLDLVYRSVKVDNVAIYFVIAIQTEYMANLSAYSKLQEIISKSHYAIKSIDTNGIGDILNNIFHKQKISFDTETIDYFDNVIKHDLRYLPNLQFLFYKLFQKHAIEDDTPINFDIEKIIEFGGIENSIKKELENYHHSLSDLDKNSVRKIFKALLNFEISKNESEYESISKITEIINIKPEVLTSLVRNFKNSFGDALQLIKPIITGIDSKKAKEYKKDEILTVKYGTHFNSDNRNKYLIEEENYYKDFLSFSLAAERYKREEISLLITPELELAEAWKNNKNYDANWAKKYSLNYKNTINFIQDSIYAHDRRIEKERLERENKRILRKRIRIAAICVFVLLSTFLGFAYRESIIAKEATAIAETEREVAQKAKDEALKAKGAAEKAEGEATRSAEEAEESAKEAREATKLAEKSEEEATKSAREAREATKLAEKSEEEATKSAKEAIEAKKKTEEANAQIKISKNIAELELEFMPFMRKIEKVMDTVSKGQNTPSNNDKLIKEVISLIESHDSLKGQNVIGNKKTEGTGVYELLLLAYNLSSNEEKYSNTDMSLNLNEADKSSIRDFSTFENRLVAYGGDKSNLYIYDIENNKKTQDLSISEDIEDRIRKIEFYNENIIIVGTFSGNIYSIDFSQELNPVKRLLYSKIKDKSIDASGSIIDIFIDRIDNKIIIVEKNNIKIFKDFKNVTPLQIDTGTQISSALYYNRNLYIADAVKKSIYYVDDNLVFTKILMNNSVFSSKVISAMYANHDQLYLGTTKGEILLYRFMKNRKNLNYLGKFENHRTDITSMYFDSDYEKFYSASLDNNIFRYDFSSDDSTLKLDYLNIGKTAISIKGHEKWIWDMGGVTDNGKNKLITSDENGNLLSWFINPKDLKDKIIEELKRH